MDIKPLTPNDVKHFKKVLKDAGIKKSALEIFFDSIIELIDPYEVNVTKNIQAIADECEFENLDDINAFMGEYTQFTNASISFIDSFAYIEDDDGFSLDIESLFEAFYQDENSFEILLQKIDAVLAKVIYVCDIDAFALSNSDNHIGYLEKIMGKDTAWAMSVLMSISVAMYENEVEKDDFETLVTNFILVCSFIFILDGFRKDELESMENLPKQESVEKVGRNEPCPCGSGKKYKKCCINKKVEKQMDPFEDLHLPMATHFPLSDSDINEFYSLWTRLIDFTGKLLCDIRGKKHKKLYAKDSDGLYRFTDQAMRDNYILNIRAFLLGNFDRIVDDFIDSTRVSKKNIEILKEWKRYRLSSNNLIIYERVPHGALVWDVDNEKYYYVYDLYDSLYDISLKETPLSMLLLPFKGRIIYDGILAQQDIDFGQSVKDMFLKDYIALRESQDVSTWLPYQSSTTKIYQLKISIKGAKPPIWRRVLVEDDMTYKAIHSIIQDIFDWYDGHLHDFEANGRRYTDIDFDDGFVEDLGEDETKFSIGQDLVEVGDKMRYIYDYGDDWVHEIKLEAILEKDEDTYYPRCIKGKGRGPLEDIGGIWAYNEIVEAYKKGDKETLDEFYVDEDFDPFEFDLDITNIILAGKTI